MIVVIPSIEAISTILLLHAAYGGVNSLGVTLSSLKGFYSYFLIPILYNHLLVLSYQDVNKHDSQSHVPGLLFFELNEDIYEPKALLKNVNLQL